MVGLVSQLPEEPATVVKPRAPPSAGKATPTEAKDTGRRKKDDMSAVRTDATVRASGPRLPVHLLTGERT